MPLLTHKSMKITYGLPASYGRPRYEVTVELTDVPMDAFKSSTVWTMLDRILGGLDRSSPAFFEDAPRDVLSALMNKLGEALTPQVIEAIFIRVSINDGRGIEVSVDSM